MEKDKKKKEDRETVKEDGTEETKTEAKGQIKSENKILRNFLIGIGVFVLIILLGVVFINSIRYFKYNGVSFNVIKEGEIIFYNSAFPVYSPITGKHVADYNIYIRNDPRRLESIPFEGKVKLSTPIPKLVINSTGFDCEGDEIIAVVNFVQIFDALGVKVVKDPDATCDSQGRYMFVKLQPGNVTSIEQTGPACYNFNINNCEILKVTEKFIVETFIEINKLKE